MFYVLYNQLITYDIFLQQSSVFFSTSWISLQMNLQDNELKFQSNNDKKKKVGIRLLFISLLWQLFSLVL